MNTAVLTRYEIDVEDVEYLRHGNKPLLARLYKPRGKGPFPVIIDLHGGAWGKKDRSQRCCNGREALAKERRGDGSARFPDAARSRLPGFFTGHQLRDPLVKARAAELGSRPDMVGILGVSSGGHQAMLAAMRPNDPRYVALSLPGDAAVDASVRCVVLCWPVIDPLGRYQYAKKLKEGGNAKQADEWISCHDRYWQGEAAMAEGNPTMALERGEKVPLPPVLYLQGTADPAHPRPNLERFIAAYRKAGGRVELHLFEGMSQAFISEQPTAPASLDALDKIVEFVHREIR